MTIRDIDELESKCGMLQDQNRQLVIDHEQLKLVNKKLLDETEYLKKQNSILIKRCEELQEESRLAAETSTKQLAARNIMQQASLQNDDSKVRYITQVYQIYLRVQLSPSFVCIDYKSCRAAHSNTWKTLQAMSKRACHSKWRHNYGCYVCINLMTQLHNLYR